ncbi:DUF1524 domain-containing protein, partial [Patescibacteria group bacterium]|nr:DUF1524 domain-containing protein [Patescibacteria group bacterium]
IQKKNFNVEHFLPQKLKKDQSVSKDTAEAIDNIGNLLVIARHTNSDLGSLTPKEKVDLLRSKTVYTNNLPYLVEFLSEYGDVASKWSKDQIEKRAREIAKIAFEKIWMIKSI